LIDLDEKNKKHADIPEKNNISIILSEYESNNDKIEVFTAEKNLEVDVADKQKQFLSKELPNFNEKEDAAINISKENVTTFGDNHILSKVESDNNNIALSTAKKDDKLIDLNEKKKELLETTEKNYILFNPEFNNDEETF
jgi:hypothetical protein